jgi:hypothetical protein
MMQIKKRHANLQAISIVLGLATCTGYASATTIVPPGNANPTATIANCTNTINNYTNCTSKAFVSNQVANMTTTFTSPGTFNGAQPTNQNFQSAFNTWNTPANTGGVTWTLVNGGAINGLTLTVNPFTASATNNTGGISNITITLTQGNGYNGPNINQLAWTQALYTNDSPSTPFGMYLNPPANTLDSYSFSKGSAGSGGVFQNPAQPLPTPGPNTANAVQNIPATPGGKAYADPIYPFQYNNKHFFDGPALGWPSASFRAVALLSTVSETTDNQGKVTAATLTVYDGVNYGFDLSATLVKAPVPEPNPALLMAAGLLPLAALRRRRQKTGMLRMSA